MGAVRTPQISRSCRWIKKRMHDFSQHFPRKKACWVVVCPAQSIASRSDRRTLAEYYGSANGPAFERSGTGGEPRVDGGASLNFELDKSGANKASIDKINHSQDVLVTVR